MPTDQALVFAAEIDGESGHYRGKAILANLPIQSERTGQSLLAQEPFQPGIGGLKFRNAAGANRKPDIVCGVVGNIAKCESLAVERRRAIHVHISATKFYGNIIEVQFRFRTDEPRMRRTSIRIPPDRAQEIGVWIAREGVQCARHRRVAVGVNRSQIGLNAEHVANRKTESNTAIEYFIIAQAIEINPAGAGLQLAVWP